jgi:hypothetical protein
MRGFWRSTNWALAQFQHSSTGATALSGAVLAKAGQVSGDHQLREAAIRSGRFIEQGLLPDLKFQDFESFYSCSPTPIQWRDPWTGIWPPTEPP